MTLFTREFAGDNALANAELVALFGSARTVSYPKPSRLIERIGQIATRPAVDDVVLDFFAGSGTTGHAVINLNRTDGGRRKYLLVEKGDYFESVLVPRIAKCVYSDRWQAGRPLPGHGVGQLFKYLRLETFEEALCRSEADEQKPSCHQVDLLETLIYRLGLRVEHRQHGNCQDAGDLREAWPILRCFSSFGPMSQVGRQKDWQTFSQALQPVKATWAESMFASPMPGRASWGEARRRNMRYRRCIGRPTSSAAIHCLLPSAYCLLPTAHRLAAQSSVIQVRRSVNEDVELLPHIKRARRDSRSNK